VVDFIDRLKAHIVKANRANHEFMTGTITFDNGDGSFNCTIKGNGGVFQRVPYMQNGNLKIGDSVLISFMDGDRQRPYILMPGNAMASNSPLTFDIGT
jgi:hypothetical protein